MIGKLAGNRGGSDDAQIQQAILCGGHCFGQAGHSSVRIRPFDLIIGVLGNALGNLRLEEVFQAIQIFHGAYRMTRADDKLDGLFFTGRIIGVAAGIIVGSRAVVAAGSVPEQEL